MSDVSSATAQAASVAGFHGKHKELSRNSSVKQILEAYGIPTKGHPFLEFYFLVMVVMNGRGNTQMQNKLRHFSSNLTTLSQRLQLWEELKSGFYAGNNMNSFTSWEKMAAAAGNLLNSIFGQWLSVNGMAPFQTDGSALDGPKLQALFKAFQNPSSGLAKEFPILGNNVIGLLGTIKTLSPLFSSSQGYSEPDTTPHWFWQKALGLRAGGQQLPDPGVLRPFVDALSQGGSYFSGISGSEAETLQYKQNVYNRCNSFIKNMLSAWITQRKAFNSAMGRANS